jgi:hypothetical protein
MDEKRGLSIISFLANVETRHPAQGLSRPVDFKDFRAGKLGCLRRLDVASFMPERSDHVQCFQGCHNEFISTVNLRQLTLINGSFPSGKREGVGPRILTFWVRPLPDFRTEPTRPTGNAKPRSGPQPGIFVYLRGLTLFPPGLPAGFPGAPQVESYADDDAAVGEVESGPAVEAEVHVDKIDDFSYKKAIDDVSSDPAGDEAKGDLVPSTV